MPSSPWATSSGSGTATPATTPLAPQAGVDQINSVNYLVNADKIALRAQWDAEQQTKAQLDASAAASGVSSTAYDSAVAAVSTTLIAAGAPANWATTWPDGTTSGPWTNVATSLRNAWSTVATERAKLQSAISAAQNAAVQAAAITTAATDATNKANAAIASAATDATNKANAARAGAVADINTAVGGIVPGATSASDAVGKIQNLAIAAQTSGQSVLKPLELWDYAPHSVVTVSDGAEGTTALRMAVSQAIDDGIYHPIDPTRKYKSRFWLRAASGTNGSFYFSLRQFLDSSGTPCAQNNGRAPYYPAGQAAHADWRLYEHVWQGSDFQTGVKFVKADVLGNYQGTSGYWEMQGLRLYEVTEVDAAQTLASQSIKPARYWDFAGASLPPGWGLSNGTSSSNDNGTSMRITATASDTYLYFPTAPGTTPQNGYAVAARVRHVSGVWRGECDISGSAATHLVIPAPPQGQWTTVVWDLRNSPWWMGGNPPNLYLELGNSADFVCDVDWVAIGSFGSVSQADVDAAAAAAAAAAQIPQFSSPAALPGLPSSSYPAKFGPVLTTSDYSLWKVNDAGSAWDRILFAATGIFGQVVASQIQVDDTLRAAVVDAPTVKTRMLTVMSDATATGPGGTVQIGGGAVRAKSIAASNIVVTGAGAALNCDPAFTDPSIWLDGGGTIQNVSYGACGNATFRTPAGTPTTVMSNERIQIDARKTYRVSCWGIKYSSIANGSLYLGLVCRDVNDANIPQPGGGTYYYVAASGLTPTTSWTRYQGTIGPAGSGADYQWPSGVKTVQMLGLVNYGGNAGQMELQDFRLEEVIPGELIVDGAVKTKKLDANAIQTTNYTQDGSGNPTAGARMDISSVALKVAPNSLQLGTYIFTDYFWRILQGLDGSSIANRVLYRGNNDVSVRGGAPDTAVFSVERRRWDTTWRTCRFNIRATPTSPASNLDAMRRVEVVLYSQSAAGLNAGTTLALIDKFFLQCPDRSYGAVQSDADARNMLAFTFSVADPSITGPYPAMLVTAVGAYGPGPGQCFYSDASAGDNVYLIRSGTTFPSEWGGSPPSGGGGGGGGGAGGGCPAPWVRVRLASGLLVDAADLYDGAQLVGVDDITLEPQTGTVRDLHIRWSDRVPVLLEDGRAPEFSTLHRFAVEGRGWVEARDLRPGDSIVAEAPAIVRGLGRPVKAQVVSFRVEGCGTYFADGLLCHNQKMLPT